MPRKLNCWEYMKCGRELNGKKVKELGVCPVATHPYADGINEGINGGRICWDIVGSYSLYNVKGPCSDPKHLCFECDFHRKVLVEEGIIDPSQLPQIKNVKKRKQSRCKKIT
ncbi:MAG TPA: hypothetical protein VN328_10255 [Thermodesulfovibrionales bacterium]|nr:hypothetical protein [Thermodesulfovibrionales bacterium]